METVKKKVIEITVRDRVANHIGDDYYVCGNSDYVIHFDFDEEWDALDVKTARFIAEGGILYPDQIFSGSECPMPIIKDTNNIRVGVFAGNLQTTTPARVPAVKSILCGTGTPAAPEEDAYHQAMEEMAKVATEARTQAAASAQSAEASAQSAAASAQSAVEADASAKASAQAATTAGQYSSNADAQAQAAKGHAEAAGTSAESAGKAAQTAIDNADDAEDAAKSAQEWAGRAETYASNSGTAADAAATSAQAAAASASNAATAAGNADASAKASAKSAGDAETSKGQAAQIVDEMTGGVGGLYLVKSTNNRSNRTQEEIRAAVAAGKTCILVHNGEVYTYYGEDDNAGSMCPTFAKPGKQEESGITLGYAAVDSSRRILGYRYFPAKTPNPNLLTFTGAVNATYDGSEPVIVKIPQGGGNGSASVQSDLAQNIITAPDYVKNRTHYKTDPVSIQIGDAYPTPFVDAKITQHSNDGVERVMRKISDCTPEMEDVLNDGYVGGSAGVYIAEGALIGITASGYAIKNSNGDSGVIVAIVCFKSGYTVEGLLGGRTAATCTVQVDEPGLYMFETDGTRTATSKRFTCGNHVKPLDDEYIPENVMRKDELPDMPTDDHINSLIDDKLDNFGKVTIFSATGLSTKGASYLRDPWAVELAANKKYTVIYNGKTYAYDSVIADAATGMLLIGNGAAYDMPDLNADAPFAITAVSNAIGAQMGMYGYVQVYDGSETADITILEAAAGYYYYDGSKATLVTIKELREMIFSAGTTILAETTLEVYPDEGMAFIMTPLSCEPEVGGTYTVTYNGTPYDCTAFSFAEDGIDGVMIGNTDIMGVPGGNPDAPFAMLLIPGGIDEAGDGILMYGMVIDMTGATEVTMSIVEAGGVVEEKPYVNKNVEVIDSGLTYARGVLEVRQEGNVLWMQDSGVYNFTDAFKATNNRTVLQFTLPKKLSERIPNVNGVYGTTGTVMYYPALAYENVTYTTFNCQSYIKRSAIGETEDTYQVVYTGCSAISGGGLCGFHLRMPILLVGE